MAVGVILLIFTPWIDDLTPEDRYELYHADQFELISIDPTFDDHPTGELLAARYPVLGRAKIEDAATRVRLVDALREGIRNYDGTTVACFDPRHAICVTRSGKTTTFLICFQCSRGRVFQDDRGLPGFKLSSSPEPVFDEVLIAHGVPLAPK